MRLNKLRDNWEGLGRTDPLWAILALPERHGRRWSGDEQIFFATGQETVDEILGMLDERGLRPSPLRRALDFGCGAGRLSQALATHVERVDGVDIAASMVALADSHNTSRGRVSYHVNDAPDLTLFPDDTFDLILSVIVLQHIPNTLKKRYLHEFVRVLRPGGVAAFTIPSHGDMSLEGIVRRAPNSWQNTYRRQRYGYPYVMEFHPLRRRKVERAVRAATGTVLHVQPEYAAGDRFTSYLYVVGKGPAPRGAGQ